ncbi:MAG: DsbA family protein [Pseudomonadota bacterium]|nr:DsbA family protein [Pseudomonadota bacterium]
MADEATVKVDYYFDYKSPYAYLAEKHSRELADQPGVEVVWIPYTLQIEKYLGEAELDVDGKDIKNTRNDHQWRRVRYAYYDCRREAKRRGMTIRGPQKIFDSSLAHIAFLWSSLSDRSKCFHDNVFERFWRRELDLENIQSILSVMEESGVPTDGFDAYRLEKGKVLYRQMQRDAEQKGVFGVPSWVVEGELFWGLERLERVKESLR